MNNQNEIPNNMNNVKVDYGTRGSTKSKLGALDILGARKAQEDLAQQQLSALGQNAQDIGRTPYNDKYRKWWIIN